MPPPMHTSAGEDFAQESRLVVHSRICTLATIENPSSALRTPIRLTGTTKYGLLRIEKRRGRRTCYQSRVRNWQVGILL